MRYFFDEQVESPYFIKSDTKSRLFLTGAAQGFSPEAYACTSRAETRGERRSSGKYLIYGWKLISLEVTGIPTIRKPETEKAYTFSQQLFIGIYLLPITHEASPKKYYNFMSCLIELSLSELVFLGQIQRQQSLGVNPTITEIGQRSQALN